MIVLYVLVAVVTVGTLPIAMIVNARDYALAEAARPSLGQTGFLLFAMAGAALFIEITFRVTKKRTIRLSTVQKKNTAKS